MSTIEREATGTDLVPAESGSSGGELAVSMQTAMARHEIEGAIIVARRFPRNEDAAYARIIKSCQRPMFAVKARYSYPRGGQQIEGPSVDLAREMARCWGNIRYGADVIHDDDDSRTIRGWAWDVETNTKETQDSTFKKLVFRKGKGWIKPDERDLLERTNSIAARCVRNCLLHLVPPDLKEEAIAEAKRTIEGDVAKNPDEARRKMIRAFQTVGVQVEQLEVYLGHPLAQASPAEVADLRSVWKSISDGNSTWAEYIADKTPKAPASGNGATVEDLLGKTPEAASAVAEKPTASEPPPDHAEDIDRVLGEVADILKAASTEIEVAEEESMLRNFADTNEWFRGEPLERVVGLCRARAKELQTQQKRRGR